MLAILLVSFGGPEALQAADVPVPEPGPGQLLVRTCAAAANPVDFQTRRGDYRDELALPAVIGSDLSGVVERVGPGVHGFGPGDEVFGMTRLFDGNGAYARYAVIDAAIVARKPGAISHEEAAALPVAGGTAWESLVVRAGLRVGETVVVHAAAGGVGSLAVQVARAAGARVVATCSTRSVPFVEGLGVDVVVDYCRSDYVEAALAATGGRGVDVIFDTVGGDAIARAGEALAEGGRVVSIVDIPTPQNLLALWSRNATVHFVFTPPRRSTLEALAGLCERGLLRVHIDSVVPLTDVARAHARLEEGGVRGKIVLDPER